MKQPSSLVGHFLIAMPSMPDPRFSRAVVYICAHNDEGAMGLVVNRLFEPLQFKDLIGQLGIKTGGDVRQVPIYFGGPVESGRGFVLHSADYSGEGTMPVAPGIALTATLDVLKAMADGQGPKQGLLALGYAGWAPGQLEVELQASGWLHVEGTAEMLFDPDIEHKWEKVLTSMGINPAMLSSSSGHA